MEYFLTRIKYGEFSTHSITPFGPNQPATGNQHYQCQLYKSPNPSTTLFVHFAPKKHFDLTKKSVAEPFI